MSKRGLLWLAVGALLLGGPVNLVFADPPVADKVIDKPTNVKAVPRGMPDLIPYWNFDPPKSPLFDLKNFTVNGDMRVRPELRTNANFGVLQGATPGRFSGANDWYVQQWMRMGLNYALSPDVDFFAQPQWAKNWGAANNTNGSGAGCQAGGSICANDPFNNGQADSLFLRQAFIMIRNVGIQGLSLKAGRQLVVMGDHRLFGHFDWANTGYSHDGVTFQYQQPTWEFWGGWLIPMDQDFNGFGAQSTSFGVMPQGCQPPGSTGGFSCSAKAGAQSDLFFARLAFKPLPGLAIEPLWVWQRNGATQQGSVTNPVAAPNGVLAAHANGQSRQTVGARVAFRKSIVDVSGEGYWQFGQMDIGQSGQRASINAYAFAAEGGVTLPIPWAPRVGLEFNMASGDGDALNCTASNPAGCNGTANTFENLYPTNHIVMGYADVMAWRNMVAYSASLQFIPFNNTANHFEFRYWNFRRQTSGDCWYRAAQNCYFAPANSNTANHLTDEIDFIYTLFFKNNKVAWQMGASYLFAGSFLDNQAGPGNTAVNQTWAYTQLHINF
ncbi:MAG: alginate export family protein [Nitrospiraceae bacterium]